MITKVMHDVECDPKMEPKPGNRALCRLLGPAGHLLLIPVVEAIGLPKSTCTV